MRRKTRGRIISDTAERSTSANACGRTSTVAHFLEAAMADKSAIEWTNATWNPVTGCTQISAGCDNCYADRFSERFRGVAGNAFANGFDLTLRPSRLMPPQSWRRY